MERHTVNHRSGALVRGNVNTNTAERFISLLKRRSAPSKARPKKK